MQATTEAPTGPLGPIREGGSYDYAFSVDGTDKTKFTAASEVDSNVLVNTVTYNTATAGTLSYTRGTTFTLKSETDTFYVEAPFTLSRGAENVTSIEVDEVTNPSQTHVTSHHEINSWETVEANAKLLTFGNVDTTTRSVMSFSSNSFVNRTKLVVPVASIAGAPGDAIVQYDNNSRIVAKGTVIKISSTTEPKTCVEFNRTWGVDFTATRSTKIGSNVAFTPASGSVILSHISFTGNAKNNATSHNLTTGTEGFNYLDHNLSASDTNVRTFNIEIRGVEADSHSISTSNKRMLRKVSVPIEIVHRGTGYSIGNTITFGSAGAAGNGQQVVVTAVDQAGGVTEFKIANSKSVTSGNYLAGSGGSGSGFVVKFTRTGDVTSTYTMDTTGLVSETDNSTNGLIVHDTTANRDVAMGTNTITEAGSALYVRLRKHVDLSTASISMVPGYDYAGVRYFPGETESTIKLTTFRSPLFELADHGTTNMLHVSEGGLTTEDSGVTIRNGGTGYAPMDVLTVGGLTLVVREVLDAGTYKTGLSDRGAVSRVEVLRGTRSNGTNMAATGGMGSNATFDVATPSGNTIPQRSLYVKDGSTDAELAIVL